MHINERGNHVLLRQVGKFLKNLFYQLQPFQYIYIQPFPIFLNSLSSTLNIFRERTFQTFLVAKETHQSEFFRVTDNLFLLFCFKILEHKPSNHLPRTVTWGGGGGGNHLTLEG